MRNFLSHSARSPLMNAPDAPPRRSQWQRLLWLLPALLGLLWPVPPVHAQGWVWNFPANMVSLDSGRRNPVFYVGEPLAFTLKGTAAATYEVRDYWGRVVEQGKAVTALKLKAEPPGWYKITLFGSQSQSPWGTAVGGTTFVVFRPNANFPSLAPAGTAYGSYPSMDSALRGLVGMGPMRLFVQDASKPDAEIARLDGDVALEQKYYLPYDPLRKRALMIAFPNGTSNLDGVRKIVAHFKNSVRYWEPRNEPNGGSSGHDFAINELKPFYQTVKSVDPNLRVLGPGTVCIGPQLLPWLEDFFKAGGGSYLDAFSFHAYNAINGDFGLARTSLDALNVLLAKYGVDKLEKWQTEQGYFAAEYGVYAPRHQGRWIMAQRMIFEQYGIPKEHDSYFYEKSHGYWDFPTWWENWDGSLNPAGALTRVWAEELYGTGYSGAYDFGPTGNKFFTGSLFEGSGKRVAAFMSGGSTDGAVSLRVSSGTSLRVVSAFGVETSVPVRDGMATLPVPEIPVYVELAGGQNIAVVPTDWGPNRALEPGVTVVASGAITHPVDAKIPNDPAKIVNGKLENWYYAQGTGDHPWMSNVTTFPATVEVRLPAPTPVSHVAIYCPMPWQWDGALLDYELQYDRNGVWTKIERVTEPTQTQSVFSPFSRTMADTFYSDRYLFTHTFTPVTTQKLRLVVYDVTWGGGATKTAVNAGGQTGPHQISLREIEIYSPYDATKPVTLRGRVVDSSSRAVAGLPMMLSGSKTASTVTDAQGNYVFAGLPYGSAITATPVSADYDFSPRSQTFSAINQNSTTNFIATPLKPGSGTGLRGDYFNCSDYQFDLPNYAIGSPKWKATRTDSVININFAGKPPLAGLDSICYGVRWTGFIEPKYTETYTFHTTTDDGIRLWIDDQPLIDFWLYNQAQKDNRATVTLQAGQRYKLHMDYFELHGDAYAKLFWSSPHQPEQIIPQSQLYPAVVNNPPAIGITDSLNGAAYRVGEAISLTAVPFDSDGSIANVRFFVNGVSIGTVSAAPYTLTWRSTAPGMYSVTAQATDNLGAATLSAPVIVNVTRN